MLVFHGVFYEIFQPKFFVTNDPSAHPHQFVLQFLTFHFCFANFKKIWGTSSEAFLKLDSWLRIVESSGRFVRVGKVSGWIMEWKSE
jgi:hypothetical protein